MAVRIAHASGSEDGTIRGVAGDQTGKEVCIRNWYKHSKGWVTLRSTVPGMANHIAYAAEVIVADNNVGYDQHENQTLWNLLKANGFDITDINKNVETDCARMMRVCIQYAANVMGLNVTIPDFYTATMADKLVGTGLFKKLTESKYNDQDDFLERGDVQATKTKGHTWVVLDDGDKVKGTTSVTVLKKGSTGSAVATLQKNLISLGYSCGNYGANGDGVDGSYGEATVQAVKQFQRDHGCGVDGEFGPETRKALDSALAKMAVHKYIEVTGASVNVRLGASTDHKVEFVAHAGEVYGYGGETAENGWHSLLINGEKFWISGKYSVIRDVEYVPKGKIADVSKWQGKISWASAAKELDFCILRAAYTDSSVDSRFAEYADGCKQHGIPFGVYQYSEATTVAKAQAEAEFVWKAANDRNPVFYVLDCEEDGMTREIASAWVKRMRKLGAERIGLYIAHHRYAEYNLDASEVDFVWIPRYGANDGQMHDKKPNYTCDLWQYTSVGRVKGVEGNVDLNTITGTGKSLNWFRGGE